MKAIHRRFAFYFSIYTLSAVIAIGGLVVTIKTDELAQKTRTMKHSLKSLQQDSQRMQLHLLRKTHLSALEKESHRRLKMSPPQKIVHLTLSATHE